MIWGCHFFLEPPILVCNWHSPHSLNSCQKDFPAWVSFFFWTKFHGWFWKKMLNYCWWFRNPAPVEVASLYYTIYKGFIHPNGGREWDFLNHQQYVELSYGYLRTWLVQLNVGRRGWWRKNPTKAVDTVNGNRKEPPFGCINPACK